MGIRMIIALAIVSFFSAGAAPADVRGSWNLEMRWDPATTSTGVFTFQQDGQRLTGNCGEAEKFDIVGEVRDRNVTWHFDVEQNSQKGRMSFAGTLDDAATTIEGTCEIVGRRHGTFTMRKQPS